MKLSPLTKEFLELTEKDGNDIYISLVFKNVIRSACEYIVRTNIKNLPKYINHPNPTIRDLVQSRLRGASIKYLKSKRQPKTIKKNLAKRYSP